MMICYRQLICYEQKAVRLYQGDYAKMTVYSEDPAAKLTRRFSATRARNVPASG